jgi:hypothetical protein
MLGIGGMMTEVFEDIAFRMAPFGKIEAKDTLRTATITAK